MILVIDATYVVGSVISAIVMERGVGILGGCGHGYIVSSGISRSPRLDSSANLQFLIRDY